MNERERRCECCRFWKGSSRIKSGDCRAPEDHRYSRVPMGDGSFAMLDSFGPETTKWNDVCGAWKQSEANP